jgi:hypothetical protein
MTLKPVIDSAAPGDGATGRIIREESSPNGKSEWLDLDVSPCTDKPVVRFHNPYTKKLFGQKQCANILYNLFTVVQN